MHRVDCILIKILYNFHEGSGPVKLHTQLLSTPCVQLCYAHPHFQCSFVLPGTSSGNENAGHPSLGQQDIEKTRSSGPSRAWTSARRRLMFASTVLNSEMLPPYGTPEKNNSRCRKERFSKAEDNNIKISEDVISNWKDIPTGWVKLEAIPVRDHIHVVVWGLWKMTRKIYQKP